MIFPQNVILHILDEFSPVIMNTHYLKDASFRGVLFPDSAGQLRQDYLYICTEADFARFGSEPLPLTLLCFGESEAAFQCAPQNKSLLIFLHLRHIGNALNKLTLTFQRLEQWEHALEHLALTEATIQRMIDASEEFFLNPFFVFDSSHRVIACSKHIPSKNEYFLSTVSNGFLSLRLLTSMTSRGLLSENKVYPEITTITKPNRADCTQLIRTISSPHNRYGYLLQFCENAPPSDYQKFLLGTLIAQIEQLLSRQKEDANGKKHYSDYFIEELLSQKYSDPDLLAKRAKLVGLPLQGRYQLYEIVLGESLSGALSHVSETLAAINFNYKIGVHEHAVILLRHIRDSAYTEEQELEDLNSILYILQGYSAKIGVSDAFTELSATNRAHTQAKCAIEFGRLLDPEQDIYYYEDYFIYHICSICECTVDLNLMSCKKLTTLAEYDAATGSDNVKLLDIFLNSDRNASVTARIMNLHRNSVLYRVKRIEEIMSVNLDRSAVRLRLMLSLHILRYLEKRSLQKELNLQQDY